MKNSRRKWDFRIRLWRRLLHCWDDPTKDDATAEQDAWVLGDIISPFFY